MLLLYPFSNRMGKYLKIKITKKKTIHKLSDPLKIIIHNFTTIIFYVLQYADGMGLKPLCLRRNSIRWLKPTAMDSGYYSYPLPSVLTEGFESLKEQGGFSPILVVEPVETTPAHQSGTRFDRWHSEPAELLSVHLITSF